MTLSKLITTPLYSTYLQVERLLEAHKPLEVLQLLEKELSMVAADQYLHRVRRAFALQAPEAPQYLDELDAAWKDYEAALHEVLAGGDIHDLDDVRRAQIRALREVREGRLQAVWELSKASALPDLAAVPQSAT